jgi:hypothetical protein
MGRGRASVASLGGSLTAADLDLAMGGARLGGVRLESARDAAAERASQAEQPKTADGLGARLHVADGKRAGAGLGRRRVEGVPGAGSRELGAGRGALSGYYVCGEQQ